MFEKIKNYFKFIKICLQSIKTCFVFTKKSSIKSYKFVNSFK